VKHKPLTLRIRRARPVDMESVKMLIREAFTGEDEYWALHDLRYTEVLVAEWCGRLVGFLEYYYVILWGELAGAIYYLGVSKQYRRRGVASRLILTAEEVFRRAGASYSIASTKSSNIASRNLFRKLGYEEARDPAVISELRRALYAYEDDVFFYKRLRHCLSLGAGASSSIRSPGYSPSSTP